ERAVLGTHRLSEGAGRSAPTAPASQGFSCPPDLNRFNHLFPPTTRTCPATPALRAPPIPSTPTPRPVRPASAPPTSSAPTGYCLTASTSRTTPPPPPRPSGWTSPTNSTPASTGTP